jgi:hypothetical protein
LDFFEIKSDELKFGKKNHKFSDAAYSDFKKHRNLFPEIIYLQDTKEIETNRDFRCQPKFGLILAQPYIAWKNFTNAEF